MNKNFIDELKSRYAVPNQPSRQGAFRSQLTRRILMQYLLALAGYVVALVVLGIAAYNLLHMFVWQPENPIYIALCVVRDNLMLFLILFTVIAWLVITYFFMGRPLRYLDEVTAASEQLATPTDSPITLSPALKEVQDELNLVRVNAMRNAQVAHEAEQRKNDLIVYLAHDLKTPLTSVIGYLTLLRDEGQISEELRTHYLSIALDKAERLEDLINEFFEITRFNLSNIELQPSRVNLTRMLEQLTFEFQPMLAEKQLTCRLSIAPDVMLLCDPNKMQRVFDNLLRNAVFYSYENTAIDIACTEENENLVLTFTNRGATIPLEKLERLFEQFYRLDTSRATNSGGAGLGLAIAKSIVELHKGTITAESADETIRFTVTLPAVGKS